MWVRHVAPLEEKVAEWSKDHPVIWNVGIGSADSFVPTLTRLLFDRTKDLYGPYDHIVRVKLRTAAAANSTSQQRFLALEVLTEIARTLEIPRPDESKLQELKQLAAEECYFGYGILSNNLMLQALGKNYIIFSSRYRSDPRPASIVMDPCFDGQHDTSPVLHGIYEALKGKRHLLLVENLQFPLSLNVLSFTINQQPSTFQRNRWLISTTSKDVCDKSKQPASRMTMKFLGPEYYHAPPFDDLREQDWAMLITEALWDAARSIHNTLQQQGRDVEFWFQVAQHCMYYSILYHPLQGAAGHQATSATSSVSSDELVRCWVAQNLIFSITSPTDIPAATSNKRSNYYRSAYEVGKVVIGALQEYSLLPIYTVSTPTSSVGRMPSLVSWTATTSASSSQDAVTGVLKLSEGVPRLEQDELVGHKKGTVLRWVSFMNDDGRHVSWNWWPRRELTPGRKVMTTLILRGCSNISGFPFDKALDSHLRVLDLSCTPIDYLPSGFSRLLNLHLLSLRGCYQLTTLCPPPVTSEEETAPLAHLGNLEVLDMNGVPLLEITQQDGSNKTNLHYLDVSGSKVTTLPSEFFREMSSLEELILGNCPNLKELPPSIAELSNLLVLHVEGTQITCFPDNMFVAMQRLHTIKLINNMLLMSLPTSLSETKGLKELHIYNCIGLRLQFLWELLSYLEDLYIQTWEGLDDITIHGHPKLRTFSLSGPWIRCLSLRGCSRLKTVNFSDDLTALEDVDLSGTDLEEVPHNLPNLPQLSTLLLLNVPCFKRFPWHQLVRFPKVFSLDHSEGDHNLLLKLFCKQEICADKNPNREKTTNIAKINLNDSRIFHSFNMDAAERLVKEGQFLQSFSVQVRPSSVRGKESQNKESERIWSRSPYLDVHSDEASSILPMMKLQPKQRHVGISANNQYPNGLRHLLSVANSIFITDDTSVSCLTDLSYILMSLEECQLQHCHGMEVVLKLHSKGTGAVIDAFRGHTIRSPEVLSSLKILQASNLKKLLSLVEPGDLSYSKLITLKLLKHIHIEHCPRLEKIFPCSLSLPALETLVILFCSNLKTIFSKKPTYQVAPSPFPNIKRIYLQELPQLQHIHDDVMLRFEAPTWEKLFVRGCQSFHRLPLLKEEYPKSKVEVSGEREWWGKLQWSLPEQSYYYLHAPPPEFVSRKKHIIRSYLR
ncbi:hypothetical protein BAE44_0013762 [Dichanthelium oligosanthes]|uniref:Disease resistance protein At4g27190-like leucine-rich repeats domain-containing protein n=1 Tax=Dichanthelium oligosanthes TaxID=888268 RepID=A0A1E5VJC8_9POAL|nr:hypothetical protein BAE44_0013762 [Dichanthelium oligosanthes]